MENFRYGITLLFMADQDPPPDPPVEHPPMCPFCGEDRLIERLDATSWVCYVCARTWKGFNANDKRFLKAIHVHPK